jgi:hypothetical protein
MCRAVAVGIVDSQRIGCDNNRPTFARPFPIQKTRRTGHGRPVTYVGLGRKACKVLADGTQWRSVPIAGGTAVPLLRVTRASIFSG